MEAHRLHQGKAKRAVNGANKMGPAAAAGKIQASMRGMLTRSKLLQAAHTTAAANSGLMTAVNGTIQGHGGWYVFSPIVLLVCDVFISLLSIYCCLLAFSDTT